MQTIAAAGAAGEGGKLALSIGEFCASHGISRATFYNLRTVGQGPVEMRVGTRVLISTEAAAGYSIIYAAHKNDKYTIELKCVAREDATGELYQTRTKIKRGILSLAVKKSDPKGWDKLANKPTAEIIKKLKLTDFLLCVGSTAVEASS
jgi:hypothetical protein